VHGWLPPCETLTPGAGVGECRRDALIHAPHKRRVVAGRGDADNVAQTQAAHRFAALAAHVVGEAGRDLRPTAAHGAGLRRSNAGHQAAGDERAGFGAILRPTPWSIALFSNCP